MDGIEEITSAEGLDSIREEWSALYQKAEATPFQSPCWLISWWRHFGNKNLWTLAFRKNGALFGIAPLFIHDNNGRREARLVGNGVSDYLDFITEKHAEREALNALFDYIHQRSSLWDECVFEGQREASTVFRYAPELVRGLKIEFEEEDVCLYIPLPAAFDEYISCLSKKARSNIRQSENTLKRAGGLEIAKAGRGEAEGYLASLFDLHGRRWNKDNLPGVLADEKVRSFNIDAAKDFSVSGELSLYRLRIDGKDAAAAYALSKGRRLYYYLSGYDIAFEKLSPGTNLTVHLIREAINSGMEELDMLRGGEKYKYALGVKERKNYRLTISKKP